MIDTVVIANMSMYRQTDRNIQFKSMYGDTERNIHAKVGKMPPNKHICHASKVGKMPANKHICHASGIYREIPGNNGK